MFQRPKEWSNLRERVFAAAKENGPWQSDLKHILMIINAAEEWEIDPDLARRIGISNLRIITPEARTAVFEGDKDYLITLLNLAVEKSSRELRLALGKPYFDTVTVFKLHINGEEIRDVRLTMDQYEAFEKATKLMFKYRYV